MADYLMLAAFAQAVTQQALAPVHLRCSPPQGTHWALDLAKAVLPAALTAGATVLVAWFIAVRNEDKKAILQRKEAASVRQAEVCTVFLTESAHFPNRTVRRR